MDRTFGDYSILADPENPGKPWVLGEGAFGVTYRARHTILREEVALKVLHPDRCRLRDVNRFVKEVRALRDLSHPNIAAFHYAGTQGGIPYCAMELCDGGDLDWHARRLGGLTVSQVLEIGVQSCAALTEAHSKRYIHRDIKPSNLLLKSRAGMPPIVKLIDFGLAGILAKDAGDSDLARSTEGFKGTYLFASPEMLQGKTLDGRSDLYSLGIALWYLFLGVRPPALKQGSEAEVANIHLSPAEFDLNALPPPLRRILGKLTRKQAAERTPSAEEARQEFESALFALFPADSESGPMGLSPLLAPPSQHEGEAILGDSGFTLQECYREICERLWESPLGPVFRAIRSADDKEVALTIAGYHHKQNSLHNEMGQERFDILSGIIRLHLKLSRTEDYPAGLMPPVSWHLCRDGEIVVEFDLVHGVELKECLKQHGRVDFFSLIPFLLEIARAIDFCRARDLPDLSLQESQILVLDPETTEQWTPPDRAAGKGLVWERLRPALFPLRFPENTPVSRKEISSTQSMMATIIDGGTQTTARDPLAVFASKIYRWVGGRPVADAAWITPEAYTSVAGLGPEANELLRMSIASREDLDSAVTFLATICEAEGADLPAQASPRARFPSGDTEVPKRKIQRSSFSATLSVTPVMPLPENPTRTEPVSPPHQPPPPLPKGKQFDPDGQEGSATTVLAVPRPPAKRKRHLLMIAVVSVATSVGLAIIVILGVAAWLLGKSGGSGSSSSDSVEIRPKIGGYPASKSSVPQTQIVPAGSSATHTQPGTTTIQAPVPSPAAGHAPLESPKIESPKITLDKPAHPGEVPGITTSPETGNPISSPVTDITELFRPDAPVSAPGINSDPTMDRSLPGSVPDSANGSARRFRPFEIFKSPEPKAESQAQPPSQTVRAPQTAAERFDAYGKTWDTARPGVSGNNWNFHFESGEWIARSALTGIKPDFWRSQCDQWSEMDRSRQSLHPGWSYHPLPNGDIAIRKGALKAEEYKPESLSLASNPVNSIKVRFKPGTRLNQTVDGKTVLIPIDKDVVVSEKVTVQIASIDSGASRRTREADHLNIYFPNGRKMTLVNFFRHHPD